MPSPRLIRALLLTLACAGCSSLGGIETHYVVCPYEKAWEAALATTKDRPIRVQDKTQGLIETDWVEVPAISRPYGFFGRDLGNDKERSRMIVTVKALDDVAVVGVNEVREHWGFRGGARLFQWMAVEPSEQAVAEVMKRLNANLKERGCSPT
ncbi:hypothetical protein [Nitrospira sp. Kam-Ns4a]